MVEPIVLPRTEHTLSRRDIDPDALKVMSRLQELGFTAYLVGGSVRDLLLGRRPKDFDIGTSAPPHQIKRAFRNCWIIGRRFRLAHVKFGTKTIEVATFRRNVRGRRAGVPSRSPASSPARLADAVMAADGGPPSPPDRLIQRDNVYGTPGRRRVPPRLHRQRAVLRLGPTAPSSTTSAACRTSRRGSSAPSATRWSASRRIRSACCAPLVLAERLGFTLDDLVGRARSTSWARTSA